VGKQTIILLVTHLLQGMTALITDMKAAPLSVNPPCINAQKDVSSIISTRKNAVQTD
jgi:hypothetical protein